MVSIQDKKFYVICRKVFNHFQTEISLDQELPNIFDHLLLHAIFDPTSTLPLRMYNT